MLRPSMEADMNEYEQKVIEAKTLCYELLGMAFPSGNADRPNTDILNKTQSDEELQRAITWLERVEGRLNNGR